MIFNVIFYCINHLGYPTYISPFPIKPPIPFEPYLVLFNKLIKSIGLDLSVNAIVVAIIAGSRA